MNPLISDEDTVWYHPENDNKNDGFLSPGLGANLSHMVNPLAYKWTGYMLAMGYIKNEEPADWEQVCWEAFLAKEMEPCGPASVSDVTGWC